MSVIYNGSRINEPVFSITSTDGVTLTASISGIKSLAELSNKILFYELPVNGGENSTLNINSLGAMPIVKSNGDTTIPAGWVSANQPFGLVFIPADDPVTTGKFVLFGLSSSGGDTSTSNLYFWDGKSSTDNPANLTMFQEIINRCATENIWVLANYENYVAFSLPILFGFNPSMDFVSITNATVNANVSEVSFSTANTYGQAVSIMKGIVSLIFANSTDRTLTTVNEVGMENIPGNGYLSLNSNASDSSFFTPTRKNHPVSLGYLEEVLPSTFELSGMQTIEQMPDGNSASKVLTLEQFNSLVESSNINLIKDSTVGGNGIWTYKVLSKMTDTAEASDGVTYEVVGMTYIDNYIDPAEIKTLYFSRNTSDDSLYKGNKLSS